MAALFYRSLGFQMSTGVIKWFNRVGPDEGSRDVFFHLTSLAPGTRTEDGTIVEYEVEPTSPDGKVKATKVWVKR